MSHHDDSTQELIYGISHDMGAPLRSVVRFSELLHNRLYNRLDEKEQLWLSLIQQNGEKAQSMIEALLCYSRLSTPEDPPQTISLSKLILDVIEEQIRVHQSVQKERYIRTRYKIISALPEITGIYQHWYLFFSSIIENALHYQPKDVNGHIPTLQIDCKKYDAVTRIIIEDNGIGVADEQQRERLTRPFMRIYNEQDYPGIGMGLTYCQRIVQLHGGTLDFCHSSLGGLAVVYEYRHDGG